MEEINEKKIVDENKTVMLDELSIITGTSIEKPVLNLVTKGYSHRIPIRIDWDKLGKWFAEQK